MDTNTIPNGNVAPYLLDKSTGNGLLTLPYSVIRCQCCVKVDFSLAQSGQKKKSIIACKAAKFNAMYNMYKWHTGDLEHNSRDVFLQGFNIYCVKVY